MPDFPDLAAIPSDMDNRNAGRDPRADEQTIDRQDAETTPSALPGLDTTNLDNALAYALDGSGTGLPGSTPVVGTDPGKVITEGTTGAGLDDEEKFLPKELD